MALVWPAAIESSESPRFGGSFSIWRRCIEITARIHWRGELIGENQGKEEETIGTEPVAQSASRNVVVFNRFLLKDAEPGETAATASTSLPNDYAMIQLQLLLEPRRGDVRQFSGFNVIHWPLV